MAESIIYPPAGRSRASILIPQPVGAIMSAGKLELQKEIEAKIEVERRRLNKASAVLIGAVFAAEGGVDAGIVADAVSAGRELVDDAVRRLDVVELTRAHQEGAS